MKFKANLKDYYLSLNEDQLTIKEMAKYIMKNDKKIDLSKSTLIKYLYKIKRELNEVATIDEGHNWTTVGKNYIFDYKNDRKVYSIDLVDKIFLHYVRKGYNFTRSKVQQRFNLTPKSFASIQQIFHLSKDSDIFSPYTKQHTSRKELEDLTETLINEVLSSGEISSEKQHKALERKYRTIISRENLDNTWRNEVISSIISDSVNNSTEITLNNVKGDSESLYEEISVQVTDLHGGSKAEKMKITEDWSIAKLEEKLSRTAKLINSHRAKKVHLNLLGDLVETVSGINHPDSWKLIEDGHFGAKAIIETKNIIIRFINQINNLVSINGVGGNHDRLQASNKLADTGATDLIFALLKESFINTDVVINYDPVLLSLDRDKYGEILCHGDKGLHKRSLEYLILKFAVDKNKFQFINAGHWHSLQIKNNDSQEIGRRTVFPSIITGNYYSDVEIGKADKSGFGVLGVNLFNEPDQIIHNI